MVDRRISVGESREEWLILGSAVGTMKMMSGEWKQLRVCGVVGVFKADWGFGRWVVEVYKWFPGYSHEGNSYRRAVFCRWRLDNSCLGA